MAGARCRGDGVNLSSPVRTLTLALVLSAAASELACRDESMPAVIKCIEGSQLVQHPLVEWCERPDGTKYGEEMGFFERPWRRSREAVYVDGELDGQYLRYWPNGRLHEKIEYSRGVMHGEYIVWFDNGIRIEDGRYIYERKHGEWRSWDTETGELLRLDVYDHGRRVHSEDYEHGRLVRVNGSPVEQPSAPNVNQDSKPGP